MAIWPAPANGQGTDRLRRRRRAGFTLAESVTALFVFALAAVAVLEMTAQSARAARQLESAVYARIVADNQMALATGAVLPPARGEASGQEEIAGRAWEWRRVVSPTADPDVDRIEIVVREAGDERAAATLLGFRGRK